MTGEPWRPGSSQEEERTDAARISRRKWSSGRRTRPRPLSDYSQLASRSSSIPEDTVAAHPQSEDYMDGPPPAHVASIGPADQASAGCPRGGRKRRPISVIGGVSLYGSTQAEEMASLLTQVRSVHLRHCLASSLAAVLLLRLNWKLLSSNTPR